MKLERVLKIGTTASLAFFVSLILGTAITSANSSSNVSQTTGGSIDSYLVAQSSKSELMEGNFVKAEAPTTGVAKIVTENGHRYLEISSAFSTTNQAPDLQVVLDSVETPPKKYAESESGRYVNLGSLQKTSGAQRYPIPDSVDLAKYKSVNVWCRMANASIGYATLHDTSTASNQ
jgi:hypothetical protein